MKFNRFKCLTFTVLILVFILLAGCATTTENKELGEFAFTEAGYTFTPVPFGSTLEDLHRTTETEVEPIGKQTTQPFIYQHYIASAPSTVLDIPCRLSADFTDKDELFCLSFQIDISPETAEKTYTDLYDQFVDIFGTPAEDSDNGTGTWYVEWQDSKSGTALAINYYNNGGSEPNLSITVWEKSRYVDAGVGKWIE